jgi:uncharacterized membrane protein YeaQ/YmgE (transglycosylase-associated protein family)
MENTLVHWIVTLVCGGVGGNIAGALLKQFNLGPVWNTVAGVLGGGLGGQLLGSTGLLEGSGLIGDVGASTVGGGVLLAVVGLIKNAMSKG